jgi:hypothetical protein
MLMLKADYPYYWTEIVLSKIISETAMQGLVTWFADDLNIMLYVLMHKEKDDSSKEVKSDTLFLETPTIHLYISIHN